jgi:hypothetical protein
MTEESKGNNLQVLSKPKAANDTENFTTELNTKEDTSARSSLNWSIDAFQELFRVNLDPNSLLDQLVVSSIAARWAISKDLLDGEFTR